MEVTLAKAERAYVKLIVGGLGALILLVVLCWGGFRFYQRWQEARLVRRAAATFGGGDLKAASLITRRALQLNDANVDATRLMAQIAEKTRDPSALDWRKKVVALNPNPDDALALVRAALRSSDLATAEKTLSSFPEEARQKPEFHAASGRLAEMKNDTAAAERHWARAAELAPNDSGYRFQLAITRLALPDPAKQQEGLRVLEELRNDPGQRAGATRTLIVHGIAHHADPQRTRELASELQGYPNALFSDKIIYLEILRQLHDPSQLEYLARLKAAAPAHPPDLAELLSWMIRGGQSADALQYAEGLSAETTDKWPVPLVLAEAYARAEDWAQLEKRMRGADWDGHDFLRHAFLARALRGQEKKLASDQELSAAEKEIAANPPMLSVLAQTIADWGWQDEAIDLLWKLTKSPETQLQALETLYAHYTKSRDTAGLYRTLTKFAEIRPGDTALLNNLTQISLLLGADLEHARKTAADLAQREPHNAAFLSTYAFALLSKGDVEGARKAMAGLTKEQLEDPGVAAYYGLVLAAAGKKEEAKEFLRRGSEGSLLPEEKALILKAESNLE